MLRRVGACRRSGGMFGPGHAGATVGKAVSCEDDGRRSTWPTACSCCAPTTTSVSPPGTCSPAPCSARWWSPRACRAGTSSPCGPSPPAARAQVRAVDRPGHAGTSPSATTCTRTTSAWTTTSAPTSSAPRASPCRRRPERPAPSTGTPRSDGRWGTRNYVGIVTSVNCSASTARLIADQFRGRVLDAYPHVDGVVALTHDTGCGLVPTSEGAQITRRTLRGYADHPNIAGLLVLGLGCEMIPAAVAARRARPARRQARDHARHPGDRRHPGHRARRGRRDRGDAPRHRRPAPHPGTRRPSWCSASTAAGPTGTPASPPTPRSGTRPTCSSPAAAPRCSPRRPRCSAPSTSCCAARSPAPSARSCSTGSTGGRATPRPAAAPWTTTRPPATRPAG